MYADEVKEGADMKDKPMRQNGENQSQKENKQNIYVGAGGFAYKNID